MTGEVNFKANFSRASAGAGVSVPHLNQSFYIGFALEFYWRTRVFCANI
jgi:hypothetical protein